jgi:molecular chaperone GrpE (heat shock protein)
MNEEDRERLDKAIESIGILCDGLDIALEVLTNIANGSSLEEQKKLKHGIEMILDHLQASVKEARILLEPIKNTSREYTT